MTFEAPRCSPSCMAGGPSREPNQLPTPQQSNARSNIHLLRLRSRCLLQGVSDGCHGKSASQTQTSSTALYIAHARSSHQLPTETLATSACSARLLKSLKRDFPDKLKLRFASKICDPKFLSINSLRPTSLLVQHDRRPVCDEMQPPTFSHSSHPFSSSPIATFFSLFGDLTASRLDTRKRTYASTTTPSHTKTTRL